MNYWAGVIPMEDRLTDEEKQILLRLARQALVEAVNNRRLRPLDLNDLPERLKEHGATFATLTWRGNLRGCIGALEPSLPLAEDVREHTRAAALEDYRFPPVQPAEAGEISIEISRLTIPQPLDYEGPVDLLEKLRPGIDGVILMDGHRRATFLPQVWEKLPDKVTFLEHLCQKMGSPPDIWRRRKLKVSIYQVEEFHE
jgi:AmmeMemoRadiSam system protein A